MKTNQININKVAILGTGVMGAQIAAHFVNAQIPVILFGLVTDESNKNSEADAAVKALLKQKPAPLASPSYNKRIIKANYDEHLELLNDCDLVLEAISENIYWKHDLYTKIIPHLKDTCILASNTSAIPLQTLANGLPSDFQSKFLGIHFFNPPRYMQLLEIIAQPKTDPEIVKTLEGFFTAKIGKGVVLAKDSPGFIGNRIGMFAMMSVQKHSDRLGLAPDLIDELTGVMIGHPKSATYRTLDLVGLDVFVAVAKELRSSCVNDPWNDSFEVSSWIENLIKDGALGAKVKKGIYEKRGKDLYVYDNIKNDYRKVEKKQVDEQIRKIFKSNKDIWNKLKKIDSKQSNFLVSYFLDIFSYSAYHLQSIANNAYDLDMAIRWGYGWEQGPLEQWQSFGWEEVAKDVLEHNKSIELPGWITGINEVHRTEGSWSADTNSYEPNRLHEVYKRHAIIPTISGIKTPRKTIFENDAVHFWSLNDQTGILSFKTKMHVLSYAVIKGVNQALDIAEETGKSIVFYQDEGPFSAGANLYEVLMGVKLGKAEGEPNFVDKLKQKAFDKFSNLPDVSDLPTIKETISLLQGTFMRLKHGPVPTVAAVSGLALGGGCELLLHCKKVVAHLESYIGLVEVGVGLIPSGAGTKEMAYRASSLAGHDKPLLPFVAQYFEQIAMAKVSTSAIEAKEMGYLKPSDKIVMHRDDLLSVALTEAASLEFVNLEWDEPIRVIGSSGKATLQSQVVNLFEGGFISEHDNLIVTELATILTGGDVPENTYVSSSHILDLELKTFMKLLGMDKTQDRIEHILKTNKPLRN